MKKYYIWLFLFIAIAAMAVPGYYTFYIHGDTEADLYTEVLMMKREPAIATDTGNWFVKSTSQTAGALWKFCNTNNLADKSVVFAQTGAYGGIDLTDETSLQWDYTNNILTVGGTVAATDMTVSDDLAVTDSIEAAHLKVTDTVEAGHFSGDGAGLTGVSGGDFNNGGDTAGAGRTLGNNDKYTLGLETSGEVRLHLAAGGSVGIGTSTPNYNLHMHEPDASTSVVFQMTMADAGSTTSDGVIMTFDGSDLIFNNKEAGDGDFHFKSAAATSAGTVLFVDGTDRVGINDIIPDYQLDVNEPNALYNSSIHILNNSVGSTQTDGALITETWGGNLYIRNLENGNIYFTANGITAETVEADSDIFMAADLTVVSTVEAAYFKGDGSALTGVTASLTTTDGSGEVLSQADAGSGGVYTLPNSYIKSATVAIGPGATGTTFESFLVDPSSHFLTGQLVISVSQGTTNGFWTGLYHVTYFGSGIKEIDLLSSQTQGTDSPGGVSVTLGDDGDVIFTCNPLGAVNYSARVVLYGLKMF